MSPNEERIYKAVIRYFDYRGTDSFFDLVTDLIDRIDEEDFAEDEYEAIWQAIDEGLIYTEDQWEVLKHYCTPAEANFDEALEYLAQDIANIVGDIA